MIFKYSFYQRKSLVMKKKYSLGYNKKALYSYVIIIRHHIVIKSSEFDI